MHKKSRIKHLATMAAVLLAAGPPLVSQAADTATETAYQRQFQSLAADDVDGHVKLAGWCRDEQAWDLLKKQCNHVLSIQPNHARAKLLLKLATSKLPAQPAGAAAGGPSTTGGAVSRPAPGKLPMLTDEQVQILRRKEFKLNMTERITVKFNNDVLDRFWEDLAARTGLQQSDRANFNKMRPAEKARSMLKQIKAYERASTEEYPFNDIFSEDIQITNDPLVFGEYKTKVWPIIKRGCAAAKCHGNPQASGFALYNERVMNDCMHYTNYLILHEYDNGGRRLINRDHPAQSLLLVYGQPAGSAGDLAHPTEIQSLYRPPRDRKYQTMFTWISALGLPAPDYGFTLEDTN